MFEEKLFYDEWREVFNKHSVKNVVIAGEVEDRFVWAFGIDEERIDFKRSNLCFYNAARIYQSAREKILDMFERQVNINL